MWTILSGSDARRLDDDVANDGGDDHEVGEEDEGENSHGGGEGDGREFEAEARWPEEGVWEDVEEIEEWIHG
ncbi:hypothetical protein L1987_07207 [Smallanthus sonchifolius]|uniref:Uncharacterized protein n=1 Tax=Smallanthus sonchifolius TaxID=185202 RepID=A0ACB9K044_9ASTR|nr:hypothetical protein L1987_07207 [Smallanthus sonchifolius]